MTYGALFSTKLLAEGDYETAVATATAEIAAEPAEPEAYFNRGQAHAGLGRHAEALRDYEKALAMDTSGSALDPAVLDDEIFEVVRTAALAVKARPDEAIATLERYRRLLPDGRHVADIPKWVDHIRGVETVWYRDRP